MPSRPAEQRDIQDNGIVVKREADYDSDATVVYEPEENQRVNSYTIY